MRRPSGTCGTTTRDPTPVSLEAKRRGGNEIEKLVKEIKAENFQNL